MGRAAKMHPGLGEAELAAKRPESLWDPAFTLSGELPNEELRKCD